MAEIGAIQRKHSELEFVLLAAFLMSLVALSIDMVLPALPVMGSQLGVVDKNSIQQVISVLFLGLTLAQIFFGPLSDQIGRKPTIALGIVVFLVGSLISAVTTDFSVMLFGRLIQGFGVAAMKVVIVAVIRDLYDEVPMARIMSLAMSVFILVPCIAPVVGQGILAIAHWRVIFIVFIALAVFLLGWFWLRQSETLPLSKRIPFNIKTFVEGVKETLFNRTAISFTIAAALLNGAFLGYLISSPQIFLGLYGVGNLFALYFALLSVAMGASSLLNAKFVVRFGTRRLATLSIVAVTVCSGLLFGLTLILNASAPLWLFVSLMTGNFFFLGFAFGNLSAIAMHPVGHIAGIASSTLGLAGGLVMLAIGSTIGVLFDGTVLPLAGGFTLSAGIALAVVQWAYRTCRIDTEVQSQAAG